MDAAAEPGRNPVSISTRFSLSMEMSRLTRDGTAEPVSRDQILRHARGQGNVHFPCSADHEQDWQPYPVDPYSAICDDHTYIHTYYYIGYKYKATAWYLTGFSPMVVTLGQQYNVGEKPTVILYTYIDHHAQPPIITQYNYCNT